MLRCIWVILDPYHITHAHNTHTHTHTHTHNPSPLSSHCVHAAFLVRCIFQRFMPTNLTTLALPVRPGRLTSSWWMGPAARRRITRGGRSRFTPRGGLPRATIRTTTPTCSCTMLPGSTRCSSPTRSWGTTQSTTRATSSPGRGSSTGGCRDKTAPFRRRQGTEAHLRVEGRKWAGGGRSSRPCHFIGKRLKRLLRSSYSPIIFLEKATLLGISIHTV